MEKYCYYYNGTLIMTMTELVLRALQLINQYNFFLTSDLGPLGVAGPLHCRVCGGGCYSTEQSHTVQSHTQQCHTEQSHTEPSHAERRYKTLTSHYTATSTGQRHFRPRQVTSRRVASPRAARRCAAPCNATSQPTT